MALSRSPHKHGTMCSGTACAYPQNFCPSDGTCHIFIPFKRLTARLTNIITFFRVDEIDFDAKDIGALVQVQAEILQDGDYFDKWRLFWVG